MVEEFSRKHIMAFLELQPRGLWMLRAHMVDCAADVHNPSALALIAALVHASRPVLPPSQRLLHPLPLLMDTALRCIYKYHLTPILWTSQTQHSPHAARTQLKQPEVNLSTYSLSSTSPHSFPAAPASTRKHWSS